MWIDLSHPLFAGMPVYPGDPPVELDFLDAGSNESADPCQIQVGHLRMGLHSGTHLDAPRHFFRDGKAVDQIDWQACMGPALILRSEQPVVDVETLLEHEIEIRRLRRLLICTGWDKHWQSPDYFDSHPVISGNASDFLVECGLLLLGVDMPSVDHAPYEAHLSLLGAGVLIVENLRGLERLRGPRVEFHALPIAINGGDASPVRAIGRDQ